MTRITDQAQLIWVRSQAEQLEPGVMKTVVGRKMYPDLVPIKRDINPYADSIVTKVQNPPKGRIQPLATMAGDQPTTSVDYRYITANFMEFGTSYIISEDEVQKARFANVSLETDAIESAVEIVEQAKEDIVMHGRAEYGWKGLLQSGTNERQPGTLTESSGTGNKGWAGATTEQILEDIQKAFVKVAVHSNQTLLPDTLLIPQQHQALITKPLSNDTGITSTSLMTFMKENNPYTAAMDRPIKIMVVPRLDSDVAIMYRRDESVLRLLMPRELEWSQPKVINGWNFLRYGRMKTGGLQWRLPHGVCYLTGLNASP